VGESALTDYVIGTRYSREVDYWIEMSEKVGIIIYTYKHK